VAQSVYTPLTHRLSPPLAVALVLCTLMGFVLTGCGASKSGERRLPRVLQHTAPVTPRSVAKPVPPAAVEKPTTAASPDKPLAEKAPTPDPLKPPVDASKLPSVVRNTLLTSGPKLPVNFLLAETILTQRKTDPFSPPVEWATKSGAKPISSNKTETTSTGVHSAATGGANAGQPPSLPATAAPSTGALPVLKQPIISVKGIITGSKGAQALLVDDTGRSQTVTPGDLTYLTLAPSKVVSITPQSVVIEALTTHQQQSIAVPNIIGFKATTGTPNVPVGALTNWANAPSGKATGSGVSSSGVSRAALPMPVKLPTALPTVVKPSSASSPNGVSNLVVQPQGNALPGQNVLPPPGGIIQLSTPQPSTLNVETSR
jgi:hypothetical protein